MRALLPFVLLLAACGDPAAPPPSVRADPEELPVPYRLGAPDARLPLAAALQEISGLTVLPSGRLGAVQDEAGVVFELDPATGAIVDRLPFAGPGDYEGLALVPGDAVWVLRSDGDLYRVARDTSGTPETRKVETLLRGRNDTEGLVFDAARHRLLIAAKEWPGPGLDDVRAIYAFDLKTETVDPTPVVLLDRALVDGVDNFRPSALAIHPQSGELYVLSSVRKAIAVVGAGGRLRAVVPIPPSVAPQPEGLAFLPDGTLFMASEGPVGAGQLLRYGLVQ